MDELTFLLWIIGMSLLFVLGMTAVIMFTAYGQDIHIDAFCAQEPNVNSDICIQREINISLMEALNTSERIEQEYSSPQCKDIMEILRNEWC